MKKINKILEKSRYQIYLRDWYYNSGIIGFLRVIADGEDNLDYIQKKYKNKLIIDENYLEFDKNILKDFFEKFRKNLFVDYFKFDEYKDRVQRLLNKIDNNDNKNYKDLIKETNLSGKVVNNFFKIIYGKEIDKIANKKNFINELKNLLKKLSKFNNINDVYNKIKNKKFIDYFLDLEIGKNVCSWKKVDEYVKEITNKKIIPIFSKNKTCFICNFYQKRYEFNNSITQILGFNKDNSNWVWGFYSQKIMICPLCALIYSCAPLGLCHLTRRIYDDSKSFFYSLNYNLNIKNLFNNFLLFKNSINKIENQKKPFHVLVFEIVFKLIKEKSEKFIDNINFIEIEENAFKGQSTKNYNVYNFNITRELAEFLNQFKKIPTGFYVIDNSKNKRTYFDISEELLKKSINMTLNYSDINNYFYLYIKEKGKYYINNILNYILLFINYVKNFKKGGKSMDEIKEEIEKITKKGFVNGKELGIKIGQENKIKSLTYQLLNDLKISNKNSFLDKYLRISMAYGTEIKLGSNNELIDLDNFMSFGYAFVNGLLSTINLNKEEEVKKR
ncbi:MAG: type I-B CRISPR-associated protein Cas8b1/Cst1 [Patescibacteria group bacterium]|nr:type I-B CRISPR-associated protein Cas8b1/Cst1 [Patescibacteria group bacterium]